MSSWGRNGWLDLFNSRWRGAANPLGRSSESMRCSGVLRGPSVGLPCLDLSLGAGGALAIDSSKPPACRSQRYWRQQCCSGSREATNPCVPAEADPVDTVGNPRHLVSSPPLCSPSLWRLSLSSLSHMTLSSPHSP